MTEEKPVKRRQRVDDLAALAVPEQPALSPDASQIVYVLRTIDVDADRSVRSLWRVGAHAGEPRQLTRAGRTPHLPGLRTARGLPSCARRTGRRNCGSFRRAAGKQSS